ncbi:MAG: CaiB/BaiF CoA transferase family protein [Panacagrimonas sp.]
MSHPPQKTSAGSLAGLRVVDLSRVLGGPYCTQILSDHGASVLKVEPPTGDETRTWGPPFVDGTASYFLGVNRNKRDIALDLSRAEGREIVLRLLGDADVLVENFKTGTMEKWGLGYEAVLRERFPRLIHCRVSGFGADGPLGGAPGYDAVAQAIGGLMSINGDPASGPTRIGIPIVDMTTGLNAVIGILLALADRQRSGLGQFVDATLFDTAVGLLHPHASNWFVNGQVPSLVGSGHPNVVPYDKFQTRSGEVFLGIGNDGQFRKFCTFIGAPELAADPRYASNGERNRNRIPLRASIETLLATRDAAELCEALLEAGVPAGPVNLLPQVLQHPHTLHRQMVVEFDNGQRGLGIPVKLSRTPGAVRTPAPELGQHTREVLLALGYSTTQVESLIEQGIALSG